MGRADYLVLGDWNAVCYQCGFKRKASTMEKNWQGYYVCPEHNEPRQTQDFVRGIPDNQIVPWSQPVPAITYNYANIKIGVWNGITKTFQLGSGLYPVTVTQVLTGGVFLPEVYYSVTTLGLIVCHDSLSLPIGMELTATGSEIVSQ